MPAFATTIGIPATIIAGDAYTLSVTDTNYPASIWTTAAVLIFKYGTATPVTFTGSASGDAYVFTLTNSTSATLTAGANLVCITYSDGTHRETSEWKSVTVLPNPASAAVATTAATILAALETALTTLAADKNAQVSVDGITYTRKDLGAVQAARNYWKAETIKEQNAVLAARGITPQTRIVNAFRSPYDLSTGT